MKNCSCSSPPAAHSIHYDHPAVVPVMAPPEPQFPVCMCVDTDWFTSDERRRREMALG